ncbi:MAG: hypothetical protein J5903_00545 [Clostridia bacterium]|nr:hypothetical protein [Clostridia bacterium]
MKDPKLIALSAISAAFAVIFLSAGAIVPILDYSGIFMAGLCVTVPLTKKNVWAGVLTYLAAAVMSLIFVWGRWEITFSFAVFFGFHPVVNFVLKEKRVSRIPALLLKDIWFVLTLVALYFLFEGFIGFEWEWARKYALWILTIGGGILFVPYDFMMIRFQRGMEILVEKLKL